MLLTMAEFVGAAEIADLLGGVSRQRVQQIVSRADFPKPDHELRMGKVWRSADVERWITEHRADSGSADL
jgi:predicted DNA-binding transcriptional regulator AlpA